MPTYDTNTQQLNPFNPYLPRYPAYPNDAGAMRQPQYQHPQFQYPPQFQQQPSIGLKGRTVGSIDEVRAAQIDIDGSKTYFPCPATQQVFVKYIGLDGNAVIETYSKAAPVQPKKYAELSALQSLEKRMNDIEAALNASKEE